MHFKPHSGQYINNGQAGLLKQIIGGTPVEIQNASPDISDCRNDFILLFIERLFVEFWHPVSGNIPKLQV